jgi:L-arabinose isomerase
MKGGTTFMEDYTYHFDPANPMVLGSHMLEICPSIATGQIKCEVHPLGIGGKEDPVRLVFNGQEEPSINVSLVDMGNRFRLIVNEVDAVKVTEEFPKLPTARALWKPQPNMEIGLQSWLLAGGAHHTVYSQTLSTEYLEDLAEMLDVELVVIDKNTTIRGLKNDLRYNEIAFR